MTITGTGRARAGAALLVGLMLLTVGVPRGEAGPCAYVTNQDSDSVSIIEAVANTVVANVFAGDGPDFVAVHPAGTRVYVSNTAIRTLTILSTATNAVVGILPVAGAIAVHPVGHLVYVADKVLRNVTVIDAVTETILGVIPVGGNPSGIAVTPDGTRLYVANEFNATVTVISTATNAVLTNIGVGGTPSAVAVHPNGAFVYVVNQTSNFVSVIATAINAVVTTIPIGGLPVGIAVHPAGTRVYVTNSGADTLTVVNAANNTFLTTVPVGRSPQGVAVHPGGSFVYVANSLGNTVSVIDANTNTVVRTVNVQLRPIAIGPFVGPDRPLIARVALSGTAFRAGQTLTVAVEARNPSGSVPADLYVGAILPDNQTVAFIAANRGLAATAPLSAPAQFRAVQAAPICFVADEAAFFRFTFPATGIPAGTYRIFAVLARQGAFADNVINPADIIAADVKLLTFSP